MKRRFLAVGLVGGLVLAATSLWVASGRADAFDDAVLDAVGPFPARVEALAALVGSATGSSVMFVAIPLMALAAWMRGHRWGAVRIGVVPLVADVLVRVLKLAFARDRPASALVEASGYAFPSGHATNAAVLAMLAWWFVARHGQDARWRVPLLVAAGAWLGLIALDRVVLHVHHATDVVAGVGLGLLVAGTLLPASLRVQTRWPLASRHPGESPARPPP